ncbi:MAG: hypothetical protein LBI45_04145 [Bacteroidales bacterium]|jgi:hypothetical protein|nr:hypothetical protein [Bacteroidales bacterium]
MKGIPFFLIFLSVFYFGSILITYAQFDDDEPRTDLVWRQKGFEFYIGSGAYFASKQTADYYTGYPDNDINLNLVFNNEYYNQQIWEIMNNAYPYQEKYIIEDNVMLPAYNIAMDIAIGAKYRFLRDWYLDISYSFRRPIADNVFRFEFPDIDIGNINKNSKYSRNQHLVAKEDRHYFDLSLGYIFQGHPITKPFISIGAMFTYTNIKKFLLFIEEKEFDLLAIAKNPNYTPGVQDMPDYRVWAGPGYGFSATVGLKIAFSKLVSLDPFAQISVASFGNSKVSLPDFNTSFCPNFSVGVRLVICDFAIIRNK